MTAFGHTLNIDFERDVVNSQFSPEIYLKLQSNHLTFNNTITYNQNQGRNVSLSTNKTFKGIETNQEWVFSVENVVSFTWTTGSNTIYYYRFAKATNTLIKYWFLHTLLYVYFTIEGKYEFIHAGSVEIAGSSILFVAPSHGGKSTLTDYFIQQNHPMISDDRVGIYEDNNTLYAISSYPYHRPYRKEEDLGINVTNFINKKIEISAIFNLEPVGPREEITLTQMHGINKYKILQYQFDFNLPLNKTNSFKLIAKMASAIPVYTINIPWSIKRLPNVYEAIINHLSEA